jgi:hypothetical protein
MKSLALLLSFIFIAIALLWAPSCANIIPPSGGPRDSLPPAVVRVSPADSTVNFNKDRVEFEFDEFVDLQDVQNNVLFTPTFERNPEIAVKGKNITVRFREPLEPNTTYTLNFGDAVRDINEMNILRGFRYTFSTGPVLDSLELRGRVILAQTGKVDSTMIVVLHRDLEDSAVRNKRPPYISRLDAGGNFHFRNLPPGTFAVYAIGDAGMLRRYMNNNQLFAFLDSPVVVGKQDTALTLYAYREATPPGNIGTVSTRGGGTTARDRLTFSTNFSNNQQDLLKDLVMSFPLRLKNLDTSKVQLYMDSSFNRVPHTKLLDSTRKILTIQTNWAQDRAYSLVLDREFAEDSLGKRLLKTDTLFFRTKKSTDYAAINIRLKNLNADQNAVLLFVQNDQVVYSAPVVNGAVVVQRFIPGEYDLRLLFDRNNNGVWDKGQFFGVKRQPEIIRPIERKINVRSTSENQIDISL